MIVPVTLKGGLEGMTMKLTLLLLSLPLFARSAPEPAPAVALGRRKAETPSPGEVHIVLIPGCDKRSVETLMAEFELKPFSARYVYKNSRFKGFAAGLTKERAKKVDLKSYLAFGRAVKMQSSTAKTGPWGLQRISQIEKVDVGTKDVQKPEFKSYVFNGESEDLGRGVDIYILDSGVNTANIAFEGRASYGYTFDGRSIDDHGHGTLVAGVAGSKNYGVARGANIIAMRVYGAIQELYADAFIAGVNEMIELHDQKKQSAGFRGSVASIQNIATGPEDYLDVVMSEASQAGIHIAISAGNHDMDACQATPARVSKLSDAVTVGAINVHDHRCSFSNFGECVSVYAPGEDIISLGHRTTCDYVVGASGTSLSAPHVAGLMAVFLGQKQSLKFETRQMKEYIIRRSLPITLENDLRIPGSTVPVVNNGYWLPEE